MIDENKGLKLGRLTAQEFLFRDSESRKMYLFRCDCGKSKEADIADVKYGLVRSCGCLRTKHGMHKTRFYRTWRNMRNRCSIPSSHNYSRYGGRGIKVSLTWNNSFHSFKEDMYESYLTHVEEYGEKNTTIDRIDNDGNYCKENCRWATYKIQARNITQVMNRPVILVKYLQKELCLKDWAIFFKIKPVTLYKRYERYGNDPILLFAPVQENKSHTR